MFWIDIILSICLLFIGYAGVCCYCNKIKITEFKISVLKMSRNRLIYWVVGVFTITALVVCLNTVYSLDLLTRLNLICLILLILPISAVDLKFQKIPNQFLLAGLVIRGIILGIFYLRDVKHAWNITKDSLLGALIIGLFFLFLLVAFKNSLGMGDVKLFALMGLYQGLWGTVNSVFFSLMVSFLVSITLLITKKKTRKDTISFGPSIYLGTVLAMCLAGM